MGSKSATRPTSWSSTPRPRNRRSRRSARRWRCGSGAARRLSDIPRSFSARKLRAAPLRRVSPLLPGAAGDYSGMIGPRLIDKIGHLMPAADPVAGAEDRIEDALGADYPDDIRAVIPEAENRPAGIAMRQAGKGLHVEPRAGLEKSRRPGIGDAKAAFEHRLIAGADVVGIADMNPVIAAIPAVIVGLGAKPAEFVADSPVHDTNDIILGDVVFSADIRDLFVAIGDLGPGWGKNVAVVEVGLETQPADEAVAFGPVDDMAGGQHMPRSDNAAGTLAPGGDHATAGAPRIGGIAKGKAIIGRVDEKRVHRPPSGPQTRPTGARPFRESADVANRRQTGDGRPHQLRPIPLAFEPPHL